MLPAVQIIVHTEAQEANQGLEPEATQVLDLVATQVSEEEAADLLSEVVLVAEAGVLVSGHPDHPEVHLYLEEVHPEEEEDNNP